MDIPPGRSVAYALESELSRWKEGKEIEPNDEPEQANSVKLDQHVEGLLQRFRDEDWYQVNLAQEDGSILRFEATAVEGVYTGLGVYDANMDELKEIETADMGEPLAAVPTELDPGIYYVRFHAVEADNKEITYTLRITGREMLGKEAVPIDQADPIPGFNVALKALGGVVERVTCEYKWGRKWDRANLIDNLPFTIRSGFYGLECGTCGW